MSSQDMKAEQLANTYNADIEAPAEAPAAAETGAVQTVETSQNAVNDDAFVVPSKTNLAREFLPADLAEKFIADVSEQQWMEMNAGRKIAELYGFFF